MKSPFPGMDPYLDAHWLDVHTSLVTDARNTLNQLLPEDLAASSEVRVAVESSDGALEHQFYPDVRVSTGAAVLAPVRLRAQLEPMTERFIRIVETGTERLTTVIEFISPSYKIGRALKEFRAKRRELLEANVSFVEIDLCRTGDWEELLRPFQCKPKDISTYRAVVRTPGNPGEAFLHPISLREPLPPIRIPLRPEERMVTLDLQPLIERAYVGGRYGRRLNYKVPPDPPLEGEDAVWANELLASRR
jgi:hypothetical protein